MEQEVRNLFKNLLFKNHFFSRVEGYSINDFVYIFEAPTITSFFINEEVIEKANQEYLKHKKLIEENNLETIKKLTEDGVYFLNVSVDNDYKLKEIDIVDFFKLIKEEYSDKYDDNLSKDDIITEINSDFKYFYL